MAGKDIFEMSQWELKHDFHGLKVVHEGNLNFPLKKVTFIVNMFAQHAVTDCELHRRGK